MHIGAPHASTILNFFLEFVRHVILQRRAKSANLCAMTLPEIRAYLAQVNLMHFSQEHRLPLRTLTRIRSGASKSPHQQTMDTVARAIEFAQRRALAKERA